MNNKAAELFNWCHRLTGQGLRVKKLKLSNEQLRQLDRSFAYVDGVPTFYGVPIQLID